VIEGLELGRQLRVQKTGVWPITSGLPVIRPESVGKASVEFPILAPGFADPNILGIHDIGTHDGRPYLVSELLEGETLRERVAAGALQVKRVIE